MRQRSLDQVKRHDALIALALARHGGSGYTPPAGAEGDLLVFHAGVWETVIAPGALGDVLTSNGPGLLPTYQPAPGGTFPPGTGVVVDTAGVGSALPVTTDQTAAGGTAPGTFIARGLRLVNNARSFGAVGDGVTNDRVALLDCFAAAAANGWPAYVPDPPVAYLTDQELPLPAGITVLGDAVNKTQSIIRASVPMRAVMSVHTTTAGTLAAAPVHIIGITLHGNGLAKHGLLKLGDFSSIYEYVFTDECLFDGVHAANNRLPMILSAVTAHVPGGSPAGVTISQPDTTYSGFNVVGITNLAVKVQGGGTRIVMSTDGGVTYATVDQALTSTSNLDIAQGAKYLQDSGIQIDFPPGVYHDNDFYTFSATVQDNDSGVGSCINADATHRHLSASRCGMTFATVGIAGQYSPVTVTPGTVTTVAGSQLLTFAGASLLAMNAREGDMLRVNGQQFPIACVLNDDELVVAFGEAPSFSLAGQDFAIARGYGYFENYGQEIIRNIFEYCRFEDQIANGQRFAGSQGPYVPQNRIAGYAGVGSLLGSATSTMQEFMLLHPHWEAGQTGASLAFFVSASVTDGEVTRPPELATYGGHGFFEFNQAGVTRPGNFPSQQTMLPLYAEAHITSSFTFTAANQTIPAPTQNQINGATSLVFVNSNAHYKLGGVPTIAASPINGSRIRLIYVGAFSITLQPNGLESTLLLIDTAYLALGQGDAVEFESHFGTWVLMSRARNALFNGIGQNGEGQRIEFTTGAGAIEIWKTDTINPGVNAGAGLTFQVSAQARGGIDYARWSDCRANYDIAGNLLSFTVAEFVSTAGAAANWTVAVNAVIPFAQVLFDPTAGGGPNEVEIKCSLCELSPPNY